MNSSRAAPLRLLNSHAAHALAQATIAEVKYESLGYDRIGVCSTYVSERISVGQRVLVYISKNPDFRWGHDDCVTVIVIPQLVQKYEQHGSPNLYNRDP